MNIKNSKLLKTITMLTILIILFSSSVSCAFSIGTTRTEGVSERIRSVLNRFINKSYNLNSLNTDLENMKKSGNIDINKINELINKLPTGDEKDILKFTMETATKDSNEENSITSILDKIINAIKSLLGNLGSSSSGLTVEPVSIEMDAKTAVEFAGKDYEAKLHANVYMHVDANGEKDSDKWVLLIHPFMLKGQSIAKKVGPFYYEKGYNILAIDSRSFGDSEGKVALGFLESLDAYDWLNKLNAEYTTNQVIVHGISLGGATTNFLSGIDGFINNGPTKINTKIKSLRELKVFALVEDCGYVDMTEFTNESFLLNLGIGLTKENFEYYSKATNSLKYCDLPMLIIHGTEDTTVKIENADTVKNTTKGETTQWLVDGAPHAFIIIGSKSDEYKTHVQEFIDKYENSEQTEIKPIMPDKEIEEEKEIEKEESLLSRILSIFNHSKSKK